MCGAGNECFMTGKPQILFPWSPPKHFRALVESEDVEGPHLILSIRVSACWWPLPGSGRPWSRGIGGLSAVADSVVAAEVDPQPGPLPVAPPVQFLDGRPCSANGVQVDERKPLVGLSTRAWRNGTEKEKCEEGGRLP